MKDLKIWSLAAVASMALMALTASTASATTLDGPSGVLKSSSTIDASLTGSETARLEVGSTILDECSGGTAKIVTFGESGETIFGTVDQNALTWSGCTRTTTTEEGGSLAIAWTSGSNGAIVAWDFKVTVGSIFGSCIYGFGENTTALGTVVGGSPATLSIGTTVYKREPSPFSCPSQATWTANYTVTSPTTLKVTN